MLRDLLVALEAVLQPLDHAVLGDGDDPDVPGSISSPTAFRSSSLKPLSRILPQRPPAPPPTIADAIRLGGKISPTTPPAIAPRLAHFLPLGSAVSSNLTLPSAPRTITAASISSIEPSRSIAWKSSSDCLAVTSSPNFAMKT